MRDIKFRIWHKPTNQFVRCHPVWNDKQYKDLGLLSLTSDGQLIFETMYDGFQRLSDSNEVDDFIVQQYTGLTDRNGQEIYEGDIVEIYLIGPVETSKPKIGKVFWNEEYLCFSIDVEISTGDVVWGFEHTELKVVGNIFE